MRSVYSWTSFLRWKGVTSWSVCVSVLVRVYVEGKRHQITLEMRTPTWYLTHTHTYAHRCLAAHLREMISSLDCRSTRIPLPWLSRPLPSPLSFPPSPFSSATQCKQCSRGMLDSLTSTAVHSVQPGCALAESPYSPPPLLKPFTLPSQPISPSSASHCSSTLLIANTPPVTFTSLAWLEMWGGVKTAVI